MNGAAAPSARADRFRLLLRETATLDFAASVRNGLTSTPKTLEPRFFYDALGSTLFEAITHLPEYYVTRAESEILGMHAVAIATAFGSPTRLVELGSGSARKTRFLLDQLAHRPLEYVPIDIDASTLEHTGRELLTEYPRLSITAIRADLRSPADTLRSLPPTARTVALFLGSSIGNLDHDEAIALLSNLRSALSTGDLFLLGADMKKPREILEPAYDDALGVTAAFNRNLLVRSNTELGGDFDLSRFEHRAFYDAARGRIEMHLASNAPQRVRIGAYEISFHEGETIHTENSWKYDAETLSTLARSAGFTMEKQWTDRRGWFTDTLMKVP
ncbi:MAG: L-histidine N(alpha)-methyltransferase [Thermoanaerobaculia bacterium]